MKVSTETVQTFLRWTRKAHGIPASTLTLRRQERETNDWPPAWRGWFHDWLDRRDTMAHNEELRSALRTMARELAKS